MEKQQINAVHPTTTVNKIGGANMVQLDVVKNLIDKLESRQENVVLVVSAFEGVTNKLYAAMDALNGKDYSEEDIENAFQPVKQIHQAMIDKFFIEEHAAASAKETFDAGFGILKQSLLTHKQTSRILMPVKGSFGVRDQVIGFGERMAGAFLDLYLKKEGKESHFVDDIEVDQDTLHQGPVTDRSLHEAKKKGIQNAFRTVEATRANVTKILGGHVLGTPKGLTVHQGRGYSDIMAVDTSLALEDMGEAVAATRFWKDVDGVYTANPKELKEGKNNPFLHRDISNKEALECASAGSGLINVNAIALAGQHGLDLHIRNIKKLDPDYGTNVITGNVITPHVFKTIVSAPNIDAITITLPEMADKDGFLAAFSKIFAAHEVNIDQIGTAGTSITFSIPNPNDKADQEALRTRIRKVMSDLKTVEVKGDIFTVEDIEWNQTRASVSVIGSELKDRPGILGSLASTLGSLGISVKIVSQDEEQGRVTFLIDRKDRKKAVRLLHSKYVDNDKKVIQKTEKRRKRMEKRFTGTYCTGT